ncbi:MAG: PqqD family protein [Bacteroidales bacterium]|nr:PqqD family protein [Bacteroidales bacterium]
MKTYSVNSDCSVRELSGKYLMMVYSKDKAPYALQVNESFARLYRLVKDRGSFTEEELAGIISTEYKLTPDEAKAEAARTLELWKEQCLLK